VISAVLLLSWSCYLIVVALVWCHALAQVRFSFHLCLILLDFCYFIAMVLLDFCYFIPMVSLYAVLSIAFLLLSYRLIVSVLLLSYRLSFFPSPRLIAIVVFLAWGDVLARVRFSFHLALILLDFALFLLFYCLMCAVLLLSYRFLYHSLAYRLDIILLVLSYSIEHREPRTESPREYVFIRDTERTEPTLALTTPASNNPSL
jgi:hypothetical protein